MADLINRSEAIRIASGFCHTANIADELAKLPSVQEQKVGKIIRLSRCDKCSLCGYEEGRYSHFFNYCPSCGCFLKGDNDERS